MKNTVEDESENQPDEIPRDTQLKNQYIESPSANDMQQNQINQVTPSYPVSQQNEVIQEQQQFNNIQSGAGAGMYYGMEQGYQQNQNYIVTGNEAAYEEGQDNLENYEYQINQDEEGYDENQNFEEMEENQEIEDNQEYEDNQDNEENQEIQDSDGQENEENGENDEQDNQEENAYKNNEVDNNQGNQEIRSYKISKDGNNQVNQESRSYKINKDGKTYQVNEEIKQYQVNSGDNNYQVKQQTKMTKIEKYNDNPSPNQNNAFSPENAPKSISQIKSSRTENMKFIQRENIRSPNDDDFPAGRFTGYKSDIPKYLSFQKSLIKSPPKVRSSIKAIKTENVSELIEIPRSKYKDYMGRETIYVSGGMETGEYKFTGQGILITQAEIPQKIIISEEEILKEINRRKNKPKKRKEKRYEILDKFYYKLEFDGKPIRKIEKVENSQKQYEYEEQQKYILSSKGKAAYQFNSKESQSQQINANNQTQQYSQSQQYSQIQQFDQSRLNNQSQLYNQQNQQFNQSQQQFIQSQQQFNQSQSQYQSQAESQSQINQMQIKYSQDENSMNVNNKINASNSNSLRYNDLELSSLSPPDNFSKYILEQINIIRTNPQSYINIIENAKSNVIKDKNGRYIYNGKIKIALASGIEAFNNAINFLKTAQPMNKLIFNNYITVDLPKTENEIKYRNDLRLKVENMIDNGIKIKSFWRDIIRDPDISLLMMIVDDNGDKSGMRRKDLLDPNMKYIGINSIDIKGNFVCYITLNTNE
jgi:hypothetical protein